MRGFAYSGAVVSRISEHGIVATPPACAPTTAIAALRKAALGHERRYGSLS